MGHTSDSHPSDIDYSRLTILSERSWTWILNPNQSYLGRMVLSLNRDSNDSLADLTAEEWSDLQLQIKVFEKFVGEIFSPDRFNYTQMGNIWEHLHIHAIPRYVSQRKWNGHIFIDRRWGENSAPTPQSPIDIEQTYRLAEWLKVCAEGIIPRHLETCQQYAWGDEWTGRLSRRRR